MPSARSVHQFHQPALPMNAGCQFVERRILDNPLPELVAACETVAGLIAVAGGIETAKPALFSSLHKTLTAKRPNACQYVPNISRGDPQMNNGLAFFERNTKTILVIEEFMSESEFEWCRLLRAASNKLVVVGLSPHREKLVDFHSANKDTRVIVFKLERRFVLQNLAENNTFV